MEKKCIYFFLVFITFYSLNFVNCHVDNNSTVILKSIQETDFRKNKCLSNDECISMYYCDLTLNVCKHKNAFSLTFKEIIVYIIIAFSFGISVLCGVGGGSVFTSLIMWLQNFLSSEAVPLSSAMMFISACITFYLHFKFKSENPTSDYVVFKIILIMMPTILIGSKIGAVLNQIFPHLLIMLILFLLNTHVSRSNYNKYIKLKEEEDKNIDSLPNNIKKVLLENNDEINLVKIKSEDNIESFNDKDKMNDYKRQSTGDLKFNIENLDNDKKEFELLTIIKTDSSSNLKENSDKNREFAEFLKTENDPFPIEYIKRLLIIQFIIIVSLLIEGNFKFKSIIGIEVCSFPYWCLFILTIGILFFIYNQNLNWIIAQYESNKKNYPNYKDEKTEMFLMNKDEIPKFGFLTGIVGGMLGIGGGLILTQVLLEWKFRPKEVTISCNVMIIFSSLTSCFSYILMGSIYWDYVIIIAIPSIISCYICTTTVNDYIKKTGRQSVLIFILFITILLAIVVLIASFYSFFVKYFTDKDMKLLEFKSLC